MTLYFDLFWSVMYNVDKRKWQNMAISLGFERTISIPRKRKLTLWKVCPIEGVAGFYCHSTVTTDKCLWDTQISRITSFISPSLHVHVIITLPVVLSEVLRTPAIYKCLCRLMNTASECKHAPMWNHILWLIKHFCYCDLELIRFRYFNNFFCWGKLYFVPIQQFNSFLFSLEPLSQMMPFKFV